MIFLLVRDKGSYIGVSLWHFHMHTYNNPNWFILSNFLHSTLVPFLC
jgi:hypothetical protein